MTMSDTEASKSKASVGWTDRQRVRLPHLSSAHSLGANLTRI